MQDKSKLPLLAADAASTSVPAHANPPPPDNAKIVPEPDEAGNEIAASPAWAGDLRKLYDAVVEEPLPDSLLDLLSQLDAED